MNSIYFHEKQKFHWVPLYIIFGLIQALFLWGFIKQVVLGVPWGVKPTGDTPIIVINICILLFLLFLISIKLELTVCEENVSFRMLPILIRKRSISWKEVSHVKVIKYNGFKDHWGFGIRYMPRKGWCYTLPGDYVVKLTMQNGKQILIGTYKPKELYQTVKLLEEKGVVTISGNQRKN